MTIEVPRCPYHPTTPMDPVPGENVLKCEICNYPIPALDHLAFVRGERNRQCEGSLELITSGALSIGIPITGSVEHQRAPRRSQGY